MILITGANGNIGSQCATILRKQGEDVRALIRDPGSAGALTELGCEVVVHDLNNPVPSNIFEDVSAALFLTAAHENAAQQMRHLIFAALGSNIQQVVRLSALKAAATAPTANGRLHHESDHELMDSGLPFTIVRPHWFMQNLLWSMEDMVNKGELSQPMGQGKLGMIDARDIAEVCASLLSNGGFEGEVLTLTGPQSISFDEVAHAAGEAFGRPVGYTPVDHSLVREGAVAAGMGEWMADLVHDYGVAYSTGWGDFVTDDVKRVLGRPPRSISEFCAELFP